MADDVLNVEGEDQKPNISAYLSAPRKKRKNFVVLALSSHVRSDIKRSIEDYLKTNYPTLAVGHPRNDVEFRRYGNRNVSLVILDDQFMSQENMTANVKAIKTKNTKEAVPILFFTQNVERLINFYNKEFSAFQEVDDYCDYLKLDITKILGRVNVGIDHKNRRKSRRYKISLPLRFYLLRENKEVKGHMIDMSVHGGVVRAVEGTQFRVGDQFKMTIPARGILGSDSGEFLKVSAIVRRVFINGTSAAFSFEYVSERQNYDLIHFLTNYVSRNL